MHGPLTSLKVLDFSQLLPGPFCSLLLADMGADVIKVEHPQLGDALRWMSFSELPAGPAFAYLNRNKRSLALDLKQPESIASIRALLAEYDILIEGFRPGVMDRLGLGYQELKKDFPGLIYCSISGYGQAGALAQKAGHDIDYVSLAGIAALQGVPVHSAIQMADLAGAQQATIGILAAVIHRQRSGQGQQIDIALRDAAFMLGSVYAAELLAHRADAPGELPLAGSDPGYAFYACADGHIALGALEPRFRQKLAQLLGVPLEADALGELFATRSRDEWCSLLAAHDVCAEPVLSLAEVLDRDARAPRLTIEVDGLRQVAPALRFSETPCALPAAAPGLGEHTQAILDQITTA